MADWPFPHWNNAVHGSTQLDCAGRGRQKLTLHRVGDEIRSGWAAAYVEIGEGDRVLARETRMVRIP